jgi:hypothetical protein
VTPTFGQWGAHAQTTRLESGLVLPVGWLIAAVLVAVLLTMWITFTATRLDRLHARVDAAQAALDAQLVRRAAALLHVAESPDSGVPDGRRAGYDTVAQAALTVQDAGSEQRLHVENQVGRAVAELADLPERVRPDAAAELLEAAVRVLIARRFYNDAVRDTRSLRAGRMPRLFHLAGRRALPQFFDIDDTLPSAGSTQPAATEKES